MIRFFSSHSVTAMTISLDSAEASFNTDFLVPFPKITESPFISASLSHSSLSSFMTVTEHPRFNREEAIAFASLYSPTINTFFLSILLSILISDVLAYLVDRKGRRAYCLYLIFFT